jgi:CRISPR/Cas system CMR-associated protein Cmr3 (group 5 of RAMP superfamily)
MSKVTILSTLGKKILSPDMHESLLRCIYEVMQLGNFVYTRPGGKEQIVLLPEVIRHQADYMEDYNITVVAATWKAFLELHDIGRLL